MNQHDAQKLWEAAQQNGARLDACPGPHEFADITPDRVLGKRFRCARCGGAVDSLHRDAYDRGLDHAREQAARMRFSVGGAPSTPLHATLARLEEFLGEDRAARATPLLLALPVSGELTLPRAPSITRVS